MSEIKITEVKQTPQKARLSTLTLYLGQEMDQWFEEKGGKEGGTIEVSKQDLNQLYFKFKERVENQIDFFFPDKEPKK